jgi:hypothetical protein
MVEAWLAAKGADPGWKMCSRKGGAAWSTAGTKTAPKSMRCRNNVGSVPAQTIYM